MAEPKTSSVFVRLTRDFPAGAPHQRAGIALSSGPRPIEVEVTDEQLAALEGDRYVEIVSDKEAKKWEDRLGEAPLPTSADHPSVTGEGKEGTNGRNYGNQDEETPEQKEAREASEAEAAAEKERRANTPTVEELVADNNRDALVAKATEAGVEGVDFEDTKAATKKVIAEAIVAKRETSTGE